MTRPDGRTALARRHALRDATLRLVGRALDVLHVAEGRSPTGGPITIRDALAEVRTAADEVEELSADELDRPARPVAGPGRRP